jgi:hypothetical protein
MWSSHWPCWAWLAGSCARCGGIISAQVFGARLKLRLMLMFGVIAVLPGALVYGVSVQFVTRSIESWFDVRVEKALESGLHLGPLGTRLLARRPYRKAAQHGQ